MILYKYLTSDSLVKALDTSKVRCSPIIDYNDPFELQLFPRVAYTKDDVLLEIEKQLREIFSNNEIIALDADLTKSPVKNIVALYQKDRSSNISLTEEQFIRGFLVAINKKGISLKAPWQKKVRNILVSEIKCFCLSEVNDNLLMWAHYSESHKGGLIGFNDREAKSFIKDARPVTYSKYYPVEHNPAAKVRSLLGRKNLNREVEEYWHKTFYSKGKIWSYEKEYRVIMTLSQVDENNLAELPVEVFDSIYLGCMMSDEIKKKIIEIRNNKYPHASIYQSLLHEEEYQLIFSPI